MSEDFIYDLINDRIYLIPEEEYNVVMHCWRVLSAAIEKQLTFAQTANLVEDLDFNLCQYLSNIAQDEGLDEGEQIFQISQEYNQETDFADVNKIMLENLPDNLRDKFVISEKGAWQELAVIGAHREAEILEYCAKVGYNIQKKPGSIHDMSWPSFMPD